MWNDNVDVSKLIIVEAKGYKYDSWKWKFWESMIYVTYIYSFYDKMVFYFYVISRLKDRNS